jgi:hypothetical protein
MTTEMNCSGMRSPTVSDSILQQMAGAGGEHDFAERLDETKRIADSAVAMASGHQGCDASCTTWQEFEPTKGGPR